MAQTSRLQDGKGAVTPRTPSCSPAPGCHSPDCASGHPQRCWVGAAGATRLHDSPLQVTAAHSSCSSLRCQIIKPLYKLSGHLDYLTAASRSQIPSQLPASCQFLLLFFQTAVSIVDGMCRTEVRGDPYLPGHQHAASRKTSEEVGALPKRFASLSAACGCLHELGYCTSGGHSARWGTAEAEHSVAGHGSRSSELSLQTGFALVLGSVVSSSALGCV